MLEIPQQTSEGAYMDETPAPAMARLEGQIGWYDRRSRRAQLWFKALKIIQLVTAGLIPLIAVFGLPAPDKLSARTWAGYSGCRGIAAT